MAVGAIELGKEKRRVIARRASSRTKPTFTADQVVHSSEVQRHWKDAVESKLPEVPFLIMYSGRSPKAAILDYEKFADMWRTVRELEEELMEIRATERILRARASGKPLTTLKELAEKAGFTQEDLENLPDVELIPE